MKTSEFINIVKEIPSPEEVEVFRLFMTLNEELFVPPVREVIVKRGGYTLLQTGGTPQKAGAINGICHKPANMTLADCMDMLLDLTQKNELLTYESSGADLWEDVTTGTPHPSAQVEMFLMPGWEVRGYDNRQVPLIECTWDQNEWRIYLTDRWCHSELQQYLHNEAVKKYNL